MPLVCDRGTFSEFHSSTSMIKQFTSRERFLFCMVIFLQILASVVARNSYYRIVKQFYSIRIICQIVRLICQIVPIISLVVFSGRQERPMAFSQFIQRRRTVKSVDSNMSSSRLPDLWEIFSFVDSDKSEMIDETELRHAMRLGVICHVYSHKFTKCYIFPMSFKYWALSFTCASASV
ncbi:hypothetical protein KP509_04G089200 [Ceratopteris richardii]|uniref:EF-hand domain-containing protein n=1 Tax=Ceratopteris richardii TaxID=49495 RepID=A0A8T2UZ30_CERRI|nr:hypothetical protein KP509_04G089200 [Ceratopteris richardii]